MSLVDDVTQYYAARASVHDEVAGYTNVAAEQRRAPIKARYRQVFAGHTVLEIACGTGYWTVIIGDVAESVLAVDINPSVISQARDRCKHLPSVKFHSADAYTLDGVSAGFSAAFGCLWWSHMPKELISPFLASLHRKLLPGALVLFVDQLPCEGHVRREGPFGNILEKRCLPGGHAFEIVKNCPSEEDVVSVLGDMADNVRYVKRPDEDSWTLTYNTKK
jgi:ubiquinone/menaquinone biosynthesis C-methylase UbiE